MLTCHVETKHDTHPHFTVRAAEELTAKHKVEAIAKLGANIIMTGSSIGSHPKNDHAEDPLTDFSYTVKTYWRLMTTAELVAEAEQARALAEREQEQERIQAKQIRFNEETKAKLEKAQEQTEEQTE